MNPGHQPLLVRAILASGLAQAAPWGIALDGLLASEAWADQKTTRRAGGDYTSGLDLDSPDDMDLPLARCRIADDAWHWAATCAYPENQPDTPPDVRYWTGRVDHRALEHLTPSLPATVSDRQGRYRARRMPLLVTPCTAVVWHAVGDPEALKAAVGGITAIGKKRSQGEGHVLRWDIITGTGLDTWTASHLHPDGSLGRPTPEACLQGRPPPMNGGIGTAGIRPPYMHRSRQHTLRLPALLDS
jgi:CRISPR type IV-associated protein Csf3